MADVCVTSAEWDACGGRIGAQIPASCRGSESPFPASASASAPGCGVVQGSPPFGSAKDVGEATLALRSGLHELRPSRVCSINGLVLDGRALS